MRSERKLAIAILVITVICSFSITSKAEQFYLRVAAPKMDCVDAPIHADIELPEHLANVPVDEITVGLRQTGRGMARIYGKLIPAQIVRGR
ncbi:unnamed protein product, partial [marine sediment metagenome]